MAAIIDNPVHVGNCRQGSFLVANPPNGNPTICQINPFAHLAKKKRDGVVTNGDRPSQYEMKTKKEKVEFHRIGPLG